MASRHFTPINDPAIHSNDAMFATVGDLSIFIGAWAAGRPVKSPSGGSDLPNLPAFPTTADDSDHVRVDAVRARGLLVNRPLACYAAFQFSRSLTIELHRRDHELGGQGFNVVGRIDKLQGDITAGLRGLEQHVAALRAADEAADKAEAAAAATFPATGESELAVVMNDAGICARQAAVTDQERAMLRQGVLPVRFGDPRVVQAFQRVPLAASGLDADTLKAISGAHGRAFQPRTAQALDLLRPMVEAARVTCASAVLTCARLGGRVPADVFAALPGGDWLEARVAATGISAAELARIARDARDQLMKP